MGALWDGNRIVERPHEEAESVIYYSNVRSAGKERTTSIKCYARLTMLAFATPVEERKSRWTRKARARGHSHLDMKLTLTNSIGQSENVQEAMTRDQPSFCYPLRAMYPQLCRKAFPHHHRVNALT